MRSDLQLVIDVVNEILTLPPLLQEKESFLSDAYIKKRDSQIKENVFQYALFHNKKEIIATHILKIALKSENNSNVDIENVSNIARELMLLGNKKLFLLRKKLLKEPVKANILLDSLFLNESLSSIFIKKQLQKFVEDKKDENFQ